MRRFAGAGLLLALLLPLYARAQGANTDDTVWAQELKYWQFVKTNDLEQYRALWSESFLGWPFSATQPARKAQITDWITNRTTKGDRVKSYDLERLVVQVSGDLATTTYRAHSTWVDAQGKETVGVMRILHTWRREHDGTWRIISGMSAPVDADGR
jgi:ketosteroid isomerase-like protein